MSEKLYGHPRFFELVEEIKRLHSTKNHDYAGDDPLSNFRECERFGVPAFLGCLVRLSDKWSRIVQLVKKGDHAVKDESIVDTLKDLASYALIAVVLFEESSK